MAILLRNIKLENDHVRGTSPAMLNLTSSVFFSLVVSVSHKHKRPTTQLFSAEPDSDEFPIAEFIEFLSSLLNSITIKTDKTRHQFFSYAFQGDLLHKCFTNR